MGASANFKLTVIVIASLFLLIVATLFDLQYLYLMAAALGVLPVTSFLLTRQFAARFQAVREHPTTVPEGKRVPIVLRLSAVGGIPQATVRISEEIPEELVSAGDVRQPSPLDVWDGQVGHRAYTVEPAKRGVYTLGPTSVWITDPLGFFAFGASLDASTEVAVHPTPIPARNVSIGGEGLHGAREREGRTRRGEGMDFHGVREYRQGDALRRVHWPTTARTGQLAVVEFERAFQQDIVIVLDAQKGTEHGKGRETTLEYAIKAAATLADRTLAAGGGVTLITQSGRAQAQAQDADPEVGRFRLFDLLARVRADGELSLAETLRGIRFPLGSHFAVLTSRGDPHLAAYLTERIVRGDTARIFFFEPASFGGPRASSPAVAGAPLTVIHRQDSPWEEGGKGFEHLLRDHG